MEEKTGKKAAVISAVTTGAVIICAITASALLGGCAKNIQVEGKPKALTAAESINIAENSDNNENEALEANNDVPVEEEADETNIDE